MLNGNVETERGSSKKIPTKENLFALLLQPVPRQFALKTGFSLVILTIKRHVNQILAGLAK